MSTLTHKKKNIFFTKNKIKLVKGGKQYFDLLLALIQKAEESIHLQSYILADDETGIMITDALKIAVQKDVAVYVLADGYASKSLSNKFIDDLRSANIKFRFFEPLYRSKYFYFGRRMHQKLIVVDAKYAVVGGMNIADRYNDVPECPAWLDFAVYIEGPLTKELCVHAWKSWNDFPKKMGLTPCEGKEIHFNFTENETSLVPHASQRLGKAQERYFIYVYRYAAQCRFGYYNNVQLFFAR
jgi:cardiolipin synthase A/B